MSIEHDLRTGFPLLPCAGDGAETSRRRAGIFCETGAEKGAIPFLVVDSAGELMPLAPSSRLFTEGEDNALLFRLNPTEGGGGEGRRGVFKGAAAALADARAVSSTSFIGGVRRFDVPLIRECAAGAGGDGTLRGLDGSCPDARVGGGWGSLLLLLALLLLGLDGAALPRAFNAGARS